MSGALVGFEVGADGATFSPLFLGFQVDDSIWHLELGVEAPFVFLAKVCGVRVLDDVGDGLVSIIWQWLEKFW